MVDYLGGFMVALRGCHRLARLTVRWFTSPIPSAFESLLPDKDKLGHIGKLPRSHYMDALLYIFIRLALQG